MSLIYQALKQSEQLSPALPKTFVRERDAFKPAAPRSTRKQGRAVMLGLLVAIAGLLAGYWLSPVASIQKQQDQSVAQVPAPPLPRLTSPPQALPVASEESGIPLVAGLPQAEQPLPTSSSRLKLAYALPAEKARATPPKVAQPAEPSTRNVASNQRQQATPENGTVAGVDRNTATGAPSKGQVELSLSSGAAATDTPVPKEDLGTLFEELNAALSQQDKPLAQLKLSHIQGHLPESSVARLRAEAWFAHQTADLDSAASIYTRLLAKIPGDELASVNLASIEKKRQHTAKAKEILARALKQNPSSSALRAAMDQLVLSGDKP